MGIPQDVLDMFAPCPSEPSTETTAAPDRVETETAESAEPLRVTRAAFFGNVFDRAAERAARRI